MRAWALRLFAVLMAAFLLVTACGQRPVRIGFAGPLTGPYSDLGVHGRNGAQLALEEINALGGVAGRRLELVVQDDGGTEDGAVEAIAKLIQARVVSIIGHMTSAQSIAALPVAQEAGMILLSPTTSTPELSGIKDVFFRIQPSTDTAAMVLAEYAALDMGLDRIASVRDEANQGYSAPFHHAFAQEFQVHGGDIVLELTVKSRDYPDWLKVAEALNKIDPQAVLFILSARDAAALAQAMHLKGQFLPVISSGWAMTDELFTAGGRTVEKIIFAGHTFRQKPSEAYSRFEQHYRERFGHWPSFAARYAYDALHVMALGLERTQGSRNGLAEALSKIRDYPGLDWPITIDAYGDTFGPIFVTMVRDGQFTTLKKIPKRQGQ
ncbi:MAG: amino acid ABC transporter substrate-binding protein [Desulfovibrionales bacterium]|nr:MAG: amino acid ABC transporter substrate-binding protein [Desulfovibrionales bacterium]